MRVELHLQFVKKVGEGKLHGAAPVFPTLLALPWRLGLPHGFHPSCRTMAPLVHACLPAQTADYQGAHWKWFQGVGASVATEVIKGL